MVNIEQSTIWKEYIEHWEIFASPGRPSEGDVAILERWLKKINAKRVLILGSTPELRDLVKKLGCEVYCMDMQLEMLMGMEHFMKSKNKDEVWIKGDWLESPLKDDFFDAILGDLVLVNIPYKDKPRFLKQITRMLKKDGYWLTKILYRPDNWVKEDPLEMINKIASMPYNRNRYEELFVFLMYQCHDGEFFKGLEIEKLIGKYYKNGKVAEGVDPKAAKLFELMLKMWGKPMDKIWYAKTGSEVRNIISEFFDIVEEDCATGYMFAEHFPTLLCRPRE
ncbi:class I SAM-dependent methyltransferase [Thermoproteota archaeon]